MLQSEPVPKSSAMDIDGMESDIAAFVATEEAVPVSEVATDQPERPEVPVDEAAEAVVESKEAVTPDQSAEADGASSQSEDETLLQLVTDNADDNVWLHGREAFLQGATCGCGIVLSRTRKAMAACKYGGMV